MTPDPATPTPAARPADPFALRAWQDAEIERRWNAGETTKAIAAVVGVSKNAVIGRAHRMGLPGRGSPIVRRRDPRPELKPSRGRENRPPGALRAHIDSAVPAVPFDKPPPAQHLPRAVRGDPYPASLTCQFPLWPHGEGRGHPDYGRFCAAARSFGSVYCPSHRALCVTRVQLARL